jgi:hypothetical protein
MAVDTVRSAWPEIKLPVHAAPQDRVALSLHRLPEHRCQASTTQYRRVQVRRGPLRLCSSMPATPGRRSNRRRGRRRPRFSKQDQPPQRSRPSPPLSAVSRSQPQSKFFHADSVSEARNRPPKLVPSPMSISPEPLDPSLAHGRSARSPSPTKEFAHLSYRKGASQVMRPSMVSRNSALSILSGTNTPDVPDRSSRRSSVASYVMRGTHGKSASLSSIDSVTDPKTVSFNEPAAPSPLNTENRVVSIGSLADSIASAPSPPLPTFSALPSPGPTSPKASSTQSALEMMNELAANARRERKVLDLEISNSSLPSIVLLRRRFANNRLS